MKITAVIFLFLFGWFISVPFSNFEATQQKSYGGRAKSGSTIHYSFKMVSKVSSEKLKFEDLWIGINKLEFKTYSLDTERMRKNTFEKGDTIYIEAYIHSRPDENGNLVSDGLTTTPPPIEYSGLGLLKYLYKGKTKYRVIKEIKKLPKVYYP